MVGIIPNLYANCNCELKIKLTKEGMKSGCVIWGTGRELKVGPEGEL